MSPRTFDLLHLSLSLSLFSLLYKFSLINFSSITIPHTLHITNTFTYLNVLSHPFPPSFLPSFLPSSTHCVEKKESANGCARVRVHVPVPVL
ncbi:hypothetical protein IWX48DRAFT_607487 [Phyllosticta citricarpa]